MGLIPKAAVLFLRFRGSFLHTHSAHHPAYDPRGYKSPSGVRLSIAGRGPGAAISPARTRASHGMQPKASGDATRDKQGSREE